MVSWNTGQVWLDSIIHICIKLNGEREDSTQSCPQSQNYSLVLGCVTLDSNESFILCFIRGP